MTVFISITSLVDHTESHLKAPTLRALPVTSHDLIEVLLLLLLLLLLLSLIFLSFYDSNVLLSLLAVCQHDFSSLTIMTTRSLSEFTFSSIALLLNFKYWKFSFPLVSG